MARSCILPLAAILLILFLCVCKSKAEESKELVLLYKDPKQPTEKRIKDLLKRMTLAEKIGQMTQIERINATADVMKKYGIGSVLSGGGSVPKVNATAKDWVDMVNGIQNGALSTRLGIPMIYGIDAVHGNNNVYKATIFPHNIGLGATRWRPKTIATVCGSVKCVVVLISGRPVVIEPHLEKMDALIAAWLPGSQGQGVTDVLFGDYGFTGKLSRTWFKRVDQLPMNFGDKDYIYDPLFPFGFGLTTTTSNPAKDLSA
ncbi:hypothetical protein Dimus_020117 [Dionaea muscipula]